MKTCNALPWLLSQKTDFSSLVFFDAVAIVSFFLFHFLRVTNRFVDYLVELHAFKVVPSSSARSPLVKVEESTERNPESAFSTSIASFFSFQLSCSKKKISSFEIAEIVQFLINNYKLSFRLHIQETKVNSNRLD